VTIANDVFGVFISHKHEDHALAVVLKKAIQSLNKDLIDCFVSGVDITAGRDWRREIRSALARSHILLLLFTAPSKNWDWCLFETGLYTRFDRSEIRSVICLFNPVAASPSPLADLQGVPVSNCSALADYPSQRLVAHNMHRSCVRTLNSWTKLSLAA
jgi:TIR domain